MILLTECVKLSMPIKMENVLWDSQAPRLEWIANKIQIVRILFRSRLNVFARH